MKTALLLLIAMIISSMIMFSHASAKGVYPQDKSTVLELREDLPAYVFEYDLERLYPSTWEFYKKLDITNRDKVYAHYLYHPAIKDVRHKIFELALGKGKGKTRPAPASIEQVLALVEKKSAFSGTFGSIHRIPNGPAISAVNLDTHTHESVYTFIKNH